MDQVRHVLVLEDEPDIAELIKIFLGDGYAVDVAATLAEAQNKLAGAQEFHAIVADWRLPDGEFPQLRETSPNARKIPTLLFTGLSVSEVGEYCQREGVHFFAKPPRRWATFVSEFEACVR